MKKLILAFAACAVIASCQKKADTETIDVSKTTYLMNGYWQLKAFIWLPDIDDPASTPVDIYTPLPGCDKDNTYKYNTKTTVTEYEGGSKCNTTDPDSTVMNYALTNDDKFLTVFGDPADIPNTTIFAGEVTYISIDSFTVMYTEPNPQNQDLTSRYTMTFVKTIP